MLIVKTYVAPSSIHGLGVFAAEPLRAGTLIWVFDPVIDQEISDEHLAALPDAVRDIAMTRSFKGENGTTILSRDNGVFLNHSENPNLSGGMEGSVAVRDISAGEELTEDYRLLPPGACRAFLDEQGRMLEAVLTRSQADHDGKAVPPCAHLRDVSLSRDKRQHSEQPSMPL
jgi:hypothetical protein